MPEGYMEAMVLERQGTPLVRKQLPVPVPGPGQLLVRVEACGVCRTDLHVLDGDLEDPALPLVLGHEIVGTVEALGKDASRSFLGKRVGIPWLGWTCGRCGFCTSGRENLCDRAKFTGYTLQGGYAQYTTCWQDYALGIPDSYDPVQAAPLLCAGLIGYRSLVMCGDARRLGIYGFGAAAHIVAQVAVFQGREVYAFTRPGDHEKQGFARKLGAIWAGGSDENPGVKLEAAIIFAPVGALVPTALKCLAKGGVVVGAGIDMTDIPAIAYKDLWWERKICSVANLTRRDGAEFMETAPRVPVRTRVTPYPLGDANRALEDLREGRLQGAAVLVP